MRKEDNMENLIKQYGVSGIVEIGGKELPVIEIPMMTDDRWQELARENAVQNYTREHGRAPESIAQAIAWQRDFVNSLQAI